MTDVKTPYEIRLDCLKLAFEILKGEAENTADAEFMKSENDIKTATRRVVAPNIDEVIEKARILNAFVSERRETR
jgi:hypothetical protein